MADIDTISDLLRLTANRDVDGTGVSVKALCRIVISDIQDGFTNGCVNIDAGIATNLSGNVNLTGGSEGFNGDM